MEENRGMERKAEKRKNKTKYLVNDHPQLKKRINKWCHKMLTRKMWSEIWIKACLGFLEIQWTTKCFSQTYNGGRSLNFVCCRSVWVNRPTYRTLNIPNKRFIINVPAIQANDTNGTLKPKLRHRLEFVINVYLLLQCRRIVFTILI